MTAAVAYPPSTALVFGDGLHKAYLAGRTLRFARAAGFEAFDVTCYSPARLADTLTQIGGSVWLLRAGVWRSATGRIALPRSSATGSAVCAIGWPVEALVSENAGDLAIWHKLYLEFGGDLSQAMAAGFPIPAPFSVLLEAPIVAACVARLRKGAVLESALTEELRSGRHRIVRHAPLDVDYDERLRVLQVVTSLQRGGAERVTVDLARALSESGAHCRIAAVGSPTREPFSAPAGTCDLSRLNGDRAARVAAAIRVAGADGSDIVHAHLLDGADLAQLSAAGLPVLSTVHNTRQGWQAGQSELRRDDCDLIVGCAQAVEAELQQQSGTTIPLRTVWNGIDPRDIARRARDPGLRLRIRRHHDIADQDVVLLSLANPRPQKRLPRLPAIVAALQERLRSAEHDALCTDALGVAGAEPKGSPAHTGAPSGGRKARLLIAGEASRRHESAQQTVAQTHAEIARHGLQNAVTWLGPVDDVATVLAAADILVSASEYEGLSLAHLEAAAAGLPIVATDAGGTRELIADKLPVRIVPLDADAATFCDAICESLSSIIAPASDRPVVELRNFTLDQMARRYLWLYPRVIAAHRRRCRHLPSSILDPRLHQAPVPQLQRAEAEGIWLVTNNFSTGGAQSSARRLLTALHKAGIRVRAAVLQEQPDNPTLGRQTLLAAGIPVVAVPPVGTVDSAVAVAQLLDHIDVDPPQSVLLWNVIPEYKVLLADGLLDIPVFDVSPGEMYFESLARYFSRPRPGLPYRTAAQYGRRLSGVIVKYHSEREQAAALLGAPVHVIPNGVPIGAPLERLAHNGRFVIGTAARISPQKCLEDLLESLALAHSRLPPYVLRIAGAPETGAEAYAAQLHEQARGLSVEWVGEESEVGRFLQSLDLFAQVSEPAGCPNASLEALAAGLPVVATNVGGAAEQVIDGFTGRLVPRRDPAAFADALVELAANPALRARFVQAGRNHAAQHFSLDRMVADYRRVCLAGGRVSPLK